MVAVPLIKRQDSKREGDMKTFRWTLLVVIGMFFVVGLCAQAWAKEAKTPAIGKKPEQPRTLVVSLVSFCVEATT